MLALVLGTLLFAAEPAPAAVDPSERLRVITHHFDDHDTPAKAWLWSWAAAYSALTVGQGIGFFAVNDRELKVNFAVGGISSLIGLVAMMIPPFPAAFAKGRLAAADDASKLARAEELLTDAADSERFGAPFFCTSGASRCRSRAASSSGSATGTWSTVFSTRWCRSPSESCRSGPSRWPPRASPR